MCGHKYVRQLAWENVKEKFFTSTEYHQDMKERMLDQLRQERDQSMKNQKKLVYDPQDNITRRTNLYKECKTESERDDCFDSFYGRASADISRRRSNMEERKRMEMENVKWVDPECTFEPKLADLEMEAIGFPHLREMSDRLKFQGFEERMEDTLSRRRENQYLSDMAAPDHSQVPEYLRSSTTTGWLTEYKKEAKVYGDALNVDNLIQGGNQHTPSVAPGKSTGAANRKGGKSSLFDYKNSDYKSDYKYSGAGYVGKPSGNGWVEY